MQDIVVFLNRNFIGFYQNTGQYACWSKSGPISKSNRNYIKKTKYKFQKAHKNHLKQIKNEQTLIKYIDFEKYF